MCKYCSIDVESFSEPIVELKPDVIVSLFKDTDGNFELVISNTYDDSSIPIKNCPICGQIHSKEEEK